MEENKNLSPEELEAQKKMESIFETIAENTNTDQETVHETAQDEARHEKSDENTRSEIELMTVRRLSDAQKEAIEQRREERKIRKNRRFMKKCILAALIVIAVVSCGYFYADYAPVNIGEEVVITIPKGAGTRTVAGLLEQNGVINSSEFYKVMSKLRRIDGKYNYGSFKVKKGSGYEEIFSVLTGAGERLDVVTVVIPEGYEIYKIADLLEEKKLIDKDKFYYLVDYGEFDYDFVKDIPTRDNRLEGYLFPDTYNFAPDDEWGIINEMLRRFEEVYEKYEKRTEEIGMTMDEVITLASIVEREAMGDEDRALVSSVFHNRIKSSDYPYLQSCATVQYVLKERKPVLSVADTKIDSPYNTYINKGLPIGPIASPGEEAIHAALYPADSNYLFFVMGSDGKHHFSDNFNEHIQNKN